MDRTGTVVAFTSSATTWSPATGTGRPTSSSARWAEPSTTLVSVATDGSGPGNGASDEPSVSLEGTQIAFSSDATNLVATDHQPEEDVFGGPRVGRNHPAGVAQGRQPLRPGQRRQLQPILSLDGSQIAFASDATNLRPSDTNDATDVFLRTPLASSTVLVSRSCGGAAGDDQSFAPHITSDTSSGRPEFSFVTDATNLLQDCSDSQAPTTTMSPTCTSGLSPGHRSSTNG